jgi:hypothetical protein
MHNDLKQQKRTADFRGPFSILKIIRKAHAACSMGPFSRGSFPCCKQHGLSMVSPNFPADRTVTGKFSIVPPVTRRVDLPDDLRHRSARPALCFALRLNFFGANLHCSPNQSL